MLKESTILKPGSKTPVITLDNVNFDSTNTDEIFMTIESIITGFEKRNLFKYDCDKYPSREYILTYQTRNSRLSMNIVYIKPALSNDYEERIIKRYPFDDIYISFESFLNFAKAFKNYSTDWSSIYRNDISLEVL